MSKSAILRKALEYVRYLQQMNQKLIKENMALKMAAQKQSVNSLLTASMYVCYISFKLQKFYQPLSMKGFLSSWHHAARISWQPNFGGVSSEQFRQWFSNPLYGLGNFSFKAVTMHLLSKPLISSLMTSFRPMSTWFPPAMLLLNRCWTDHA